MRKGVFVSESNGDVITVEEEKICVPTLINPIQSGSTTAQGDSSPTAKTPNGLPAVLTCSVPPIAAATKTYNVVGRIKLTEFAVAYHTKLLYSL